MNAYLRVITPISMDRKETRTNPNSGNRIAQGKGVHSEVESEGSRRQTSGLTNRNVFQMEPKIGTAVCRTARTVV